MSKKQENELRKWAREFYQPESTIDECWPEVVIQECRRINNEVKTEVLDNIFND
jgi:hypothetical protein